MNYHTTYIPEGYELAYVDMQINKNKTTALHTAYENLCSASSRIASVDAEIQHVAKTIEDVKRENNEIKERIRKLNNILSSTL